jgi:tricorn protease
MRLIRLAFLLALAAWPAALAAQVDARLLQQPAVSATHLAFVYAGDIWVAPKEGGVAQRLTTAKGDEHYPKFSPEGSQIAFTGDYEGNPDIYVMPAMGGAPLRVTHNPSPDRVLGWTPDGRSLIYASPMASGTDRFSQLYEVRATGGLPEMLPVPYGEFGALSPDGTWLAYMPNSQDLRTWKRYRGGDVSRIVLFDLKSHQSKRVGDDGASYSQPMWHGATLYFISDRDANKRYNLYAYDTATAAIRQLTHFETFDVHFPSIGPSDLVYEAGGQLYLMDLATEKARPVQVQVVTDEATLRPRLEKTADLVAHAAVSPSGKRVVFEARGDLFSVPAENGPTYDLTRTSGVAERYPALSPDGKSLAYWSDRTGEYELTLRPADGSGQEHTVTKLGPGYRYRIYWSPDGKRVAFVDQAMRINLCDLATGDVTQVDKGLWMFEEVQDDGHESLEGFAVSWSADGRWVAWSRELDNRLGAIFLYDTQTAKTTQVTSGFYYDARPAFDPDGKYLFLLTKRHFQPVYGNIDPTWIYANLTQVAAVPLRADVASPLAPRDDKEEPESRGAGEPEKDKSKDKETGKEKAKPEPVNIDLAGFEERMVILPPKPGTYDQLAVVSGKVLYRNIGLAGSPEDEKTPLMVYDLKEREEKTVLPDVDRFQVAAGGEKLLVLQKKDWAIVEPKPDQKMEKKLDLSAMEMTVDPRAEWKQIFTDAWRFERDFFYDPGMHGVDWAQMRVRYGALIDQCATRSDVNYVLGELIGELNSSHTYRGGGDVERPEKRHGGLLGCDYVLEGGAYKISKIYEGAPWDTEARSPLKEPGTGVKEGEYLLAVNGVPVDSAKDPWAALDGMAGSTVSLSVSATPSMSGARQVLVKPLDDESRLRHLAWAQANREKVAKASGGRLGYIYVPDTGTDGQNELYRQFVGQFTKEGLVVDERWNSGGQIPDRFIELLNRPITNYWRVRDGKDWQWPEFANAGPKVMLINGWSGSGGDCFPLYFRMAKLGPLVGRRTWGGLIGISGSPSLVDGGVVTVPTFGMYSPEGKWLVEGHGVEPDIVVEDDPSLMVGGGDPQLDRAIQEAVTLLQQNPPQAPRRPDYENRSGR